MHLAKVLHELHERNTWFALPSTQSGRSTLESLFRMLLPLVPPVHELVRGLSQTALSRFPYRCTHPLQAVSGTCAKVLMAAWPWATQKRRCTSTLPPAADTQDTTNQTYQGRAGKRNNRSVCASCPGLGTCEHISQEPREVGAVGISRLATLPGLNQAAHVVHLTRCIESTRAGDSNRPL